MPNLAINGGPKTYTGTWPTWPIWGDEERQGLNAVLESGKWWYGERVREFEAAFAGFQGAKHGVTCSSGTTALEVALIALGIGAGDEVIVPSYTFVATASAVMRANAVPIFADILPSNLCIDPDDVERKITSRTKAIMPVHIAGHVCDMDRLLEIAGRHHLRIIEDACHAWGSQWRGKGAGVVGDCGIFSFQASKNINAGEGGIILSDSTELADQCRSYTHCGRGKDKPWYEHYLLGSNLRMTEFQAALLLAQLTRVEKHMTLRSQSAAILDRGLSAIPGIQILSNDPRMTRRSYHIYCFRLNASRLGISREQFLRAVQAEGVPIQLGYTPLYKNPLFQNRGEGPKFCPISCPFHGQTIDYTKVHCPVCEQVCADTVWIKQQNLLAEPAAIQALVEAIGKVCANAAEIA